MELINNFPYLPAFVLLSLLFGLTSVIAVTATSFLKIVIILHILKSALGLQQTPPTTAINALAIILSAYIMAPVGLAAYERFNSMDVDLRELKVERLAEAAQYSIKPVKGFLEDNAQPRELSFFREASRELWGEDTEVGREDSHFLVLLPAFTISELKDAFKIGFLVYLPFLVVDIIVSNVLLSLGMIMLSPITISMPFKLLLFIFVDGWGMVLHGLIYSYQ